MFTWSRTPGDALSTGMDAYHDALYRAIYAICLRRKPEIENWMKAKAPWTDRTGNARAALHADVIATMDAITMQLAHGMFYGIYLETNYAGKYAIVGPAVDYWSSIIMSDVRALLR